MVTQESLPLPPLGASNTVIINARCSLRIEAAQRAIVVAGLPVHHYCADDAVAEAYAMVFWVVHGPCRSRQNRTRIRCRARTELASVVRIFCAPTALIFLEIRAAELAGLMHLRCKF